MLHGAGNGSDNGEAGAEPAKRVPASGNRQCTLRHRAQAPARSRIIFPNHQGKYGDFCYLKPARFIVAEQKTNALRLFRRNVLLLKIREF